MAEEIHAGAPAHHCGLNLWLMAGWKLWLGAISWRWIATSWVRYCSGLCSVSHCSTHAIEPCHPPVVPSWEPIHFADSFSAKQIKVSCWVYCSASSIWQNRAGALNVHRLSIVTDERKSCFLPTSQIYKLGYYLTQTLLFKPVVLASGRRSGFAKRLLRTLKLSFSSYLKTSLTETLFKGNHKRRKQQLQWSVFVHIEECDDIILECAFFLRFLFWW